MMKRRLTALFLALALCAGLTVPAFAAETEDILNTINEDGIWLDIADTTDLEKEISARFRLWEPDNGTYTKAKEAMAAITIDVIELPLGVTMTTGPGSVWEEGMFVYSDPDGDGVYDHQLAMASGNSVGLVPLGEAGPLKDSDTTAYYGVFYWTYGSDALRLGPVDYNGYRTITTDFLVGFFGKNTLLELWDEEHENARYFLLTGEERPEDLAYDKLEDRGIYINGAGSLVSSWAVEYTNAAVQTSLLLYPVAADHDFDLRGKITRAQFTSVAVELYMRMSGEELEPPENNPFEDVADDNMYVNYIAAAYELGIVGGYPDGTFRPDELVTREQTAAMLARTFTKLGGEVPEVEATTFADDASISAYAKNAVALMNEKGIIGGMGGNTFAPQGDATVEQALKIAVEMLNNLEV